MYCSIYPYCHSGISSTVASESRTHLQWRGTRMSTRVLHNVGPLTRALPGSREARGGYRVQLWDWACASVCFPRVSLLRFSGRGPSCFAPRGGTWSFTDSTSLSISWRSIILLGLASRPPFGYICTIESYFEWERRSHGVPAIPVCIHVNQCDTRGNGITGYCGFS